MKSFDKLAKALSDKGELSFAEELSLVEDLESSLKYLSDKEIDIIDDLLLEEEKSLLELSLFDFMTSSWRWVDPAKFSSNWHHQYICEHLEALVRREIRVLVVNIPPRSTKSIACSVLFPAWVWAHPPQEGTWLGPQTSWIFASYAQSLTLFHSTMCRSLLLSKWYQRRWGETVTLRHDQAAKSEYALENGGMRLSLSVGSQITGRGYDIMGIDDPHNATEAESDDVRQGVINWYRQAVSTRANDPATSCQFLVMQRLHEADLCGYFMNQEEFVDAHLCFPMEYEKSHPFKSYSFLKVKDPRKKTGDLLWPSRVDAKELRRMKQNLGSYNSAGQLQQRPAPEGGGMIKPDHIHLLDEIPEDWEIEHAVRGWDFAATKEAERKKQDVPYTVGVKMIKFVGNPIYYIVHVKRKREGPEGVKKIFKATVEADGPDVLQDIPQDPGQAGVYQVSDLRKAVRGYPIKTSPEKGDKVLRAMPFAADVEDGLIGAVRDAWWQDYYDELELFDAGKYKDQVDATSRTYRRLSILCGKTRMDEVAPHHESRAEEKKTQKDPSRWGAESAYEKEVGREPVSKGKSEHVIGL